MNLDPFYAVSILRSDISIKEKVKELIRLTGFYENKKSSVLLVNKLGVAKGTKATALFLP